MKRNKIFYLAALLLLALLIIAIFAPWIAPHDPAYIDISKKLASPSSEHLLGTDHMGRDVLSRLIYGTRLSLSIAIIVTFITIAIGTPIGIYVGWKGGKVEQGFTWISNIIMAFPTFLLSMALAGILGQGVSNIIIAVSMVGWLYYARMIRNMVLNIKNRGYVLSAKGMGASSFYIIWKHIIPFIFKPIMVLGLLKMGSIILMISGFSFLGIGVQPNISEWGMMLNDAKPYFRRIPGLMIYPGLAIFLSVLSFNLLGEYFDKKGIIKLWDN